MPSLARLASHTRAPSLLVSMSQADLGRFLWAFLFHWPYESSGRLGRISGRLLMPTGRSEFYLPRAFGSCALTPLAGNRRQSVDAGIHLVARRIQSFRCHRLGLSGPKSVPPIFEEDIEQRHERRRAWPRSARTPSSSSPGRRHCDVGVHGLRRKSCGRPASRIRTSSARTSTPPMALREAEFFNGERRAFAKPAAAYGGDDAAPRHIQKGQLEDAGRGRRRLDRRLVQRVDDPRRCERRRGFAARSRVVERARTPTS